MLTLIADVDDTVCPSTRPISPALAREIDRLVSGGCAFAFISGSTIPQISAQITPFLTVPHHLLGASGTHYVRVDRAEGKASPVEVYRLEFSPEERAEILRAFEALIEKYAIRSLTDKADQLQDRSSQITLSAVGRHAPEAAKRALDPDGVKRREWVGFLRGLLGDKYSLRVGGTTSIDVTPAGVDKAWGIRRFLKENGLRASECLFFGDKLGPGGNDAPALEVVDCLEVRGPDHTLEILSRFKTGAR
ncbi:MAG TPA: HAD-IIB family hydrolase [bacterium]|nr:HAD-IIB family hydrolase [bacterium]